MKSIIFLTLIGTSTISFATSKKVTCTNDDSKIVFQLGNLSEGIKIDQKESQLQYELADLEEMQTLSVKRSIKSWTVVTLEGDNNDDSQMIATLVLDSAHLNARLSIQILVDGLEGGTYSKAFECTLK